MKGGKRKGLTATLRRVDVLIVLMLGALLVAGSALAQGSNGVLPESFNSNVNLIGMTPNPDDIPDVGYRQQNEPSCTVRPGDAACIICAYNDYRGVDFPLGNPIGDSWLGVSESCDAGATWRSRIMPGHPGDGDADVIPAAFAADPRVVSVPGVGNPGMTIINFIAGFRDTNVGVLGIQHWLEVNKEDADHNEPSKITWFADEGTSGRFIDKPDILPVVDALNQQGTITLATEMENSNLGDNGVITRDFVTGKLYVAYAVLTGSQSFKVLVKTSDDWGRTWKNQVLKLSEDQNQVSGVSLTAVGNKVIAVWRRKGDNNDPDSILYSIITNGGKKATKAEVLADICAFDQPTLAGESFDIGGETQGPFVAFRTNDFPWAATDGDNVFVFYSELNQKNPDGSCDFIGGRPRIVMKYSTDAGQNWQGEAGTDTPITLDAPGGLATQSFQFMPTAFGANGRIQVAWYDTRREIFGGAGTVWPFVTDYDVADALFVQRAVDVYTTSVTLESGGPVIPPPIRLSQYSQQLAQNKTTGQLFYIDTKANLANKKLFAQGFASFLGDYLAMAARAFRPAAGGKWESNASLRPPGLGGEDFFAAWADNRDVVGEVLGLTDPSSYGFEANAGANNQEDEEKPKEMLADGRPAPTTGPPRDRTKTAEGLDGTDNIVACVPGAENERTRDANIYGARIPEDLRLFASTPSKPLSGLKRTFPVSLTNSTEFDELYTLNILPPTDASFRQQSQVSSEQVLVRAFSTEARTVFVDPFDVDSVTVQAVLGGEVVATIVLGNTPDFSDPANCVDGFLQDQVDDEGNPIPCDVDENELHDLELQELSPEAAALLNATLLNAALLNIGVSATELAAELAAGDVNAALLNAALLNANLLNANLLNPTLVALALEGGSADPTCDTMEPTYPSLCPGYTGDPMTADIIAFAYDDGGETINAALLNAALLNAALLNANLLNANLLNANLLNANLLNANLLNANLLNANLLNANLLNANLLNANLLNADLLNANLLNANLLNANLLNATIAGDPDATVTFDDYTYPITNNGNVKTSINADIQIAAPPALDADGNPIDVDEDGNPIKDVLGTKLIAWSANATPTRIDCEDRVQLDSRVHSIAPNPDNDLEVAEIETPFEGEVTVVAAPGETVFFTLRVVGTPAQLRNVRVSGFTASSQASNCVVDGSPDGYTCEDNLRDDNERILFQDTIPPVLTIIGDNPTIVEAGVETYVERGATAIDNIDGDITASVNINPMPGEVDSSVPGVNFWVEYTVSDSAGNPATPVTRTVNVVDTIAPVITLNPNADGDIDFTLEAGVDAYLEPGFSLVEAGVPSTTVVVGGDTVNPGVLGTYVVTYTADDGFNPPTVVTRTVTVDDTTSPVLPALPDLSTEATSTDGTPVSWATEATDAFAGVVPLVCSPESGSAFDIGETTVDCSATDTNGNVSTDAFLVTITDNTPPVIDPVSPPTGFDPGSPYPFELASTANSIMVTWPVSVTDADPNLVISCSIGGVDLPLDGPPVLDDDQITATFTYDFPVGDTLVTCTATDSVNPPTTFDFTVSVLDVTPPDAPGIPPDDFSSVEATGPNGATVSWAPLFANDAVSGAIEATCVPTSGSVFSLGTTEVSCTATDDAGLVSTASTFDVTIVDTTSPSLNGVPIGTVFVAAGPDGTALPDYSGISASDIVDPAPTATCLPAGPLPFGENLITCTATDASGNSTLASYVIDVVDETNPTITLIGPASITLEAGVESYVEQGATASDNVDGDLTGAIVITGSVDTATVGTYTVFYNVSDNQGNNAATVTRTVVVQDTIKPVITVPDSPLLITTEISPAVVAFDVTVDDAGAPGIVASCVPASESEFSFGDTLVTCNASDGINAADPATFTVTVRYLYDIDLILPKGRARAGSTIPIDVQYNDWDTMLPVDSSAVPISIFWASTDDCLTSNNGTTGGDDSGDSKWRYNASDMIWQYSWQTKDEGLVAGDYLVIIDPPGADVPDAVECVTLR